MSKSVTFGVNNNNATIEMLTGSNYKKWKEDIEFALGIVDLDLALRVEKLAEPTTDSSAEDRDYYAKWERSNWLSLIGIKRSIPEHLISGLPETDNAKTFMKNVGERFHMSNKAEAGQLMNDLLGMRYDASKGVREYITKFVHIQAKLKNHEIPLPDDYVIYASLYSLPTEFSQIKTAYNT